jgi:hypothetical protein
MLRKGDKAKKSILLSIFLVLSTNLAYGATYYVDNSIGDCDGSYNPLTRLCSGGSDISYNTVAEAITAASSGDTISIRSGTYATSSTLSVTKFRGLKTTIEGYTTDSRPKIRLINNTEDPLFDANGAAILFKYLELQGDKSQCEGYVVGPPEDCGGYDATLIYANAGVIEADDVIFRDGNHGAVKDNARWHIHHSQFYNNGVSGTDHDLYIAADHPAANDAPVFEYNYFYNPAGYSLHVYGGGPSPNYGIFRYNIVDCGSTTADDANGFLMGGEYWQVYNNVFENCKRGGIWWGSDGPNYNEFKNNIFHNIGTYIHVIDEYGQGQCPGDNNVVTNNYYGSRGNGILDSSGCNSSGILSFDDVPLNIDNMNNPFVVPNPDSWDDYRLADGSGAIDVGVSLGPANDAALASFDTIWPPSTTDQDDYGSRWEIGAFVYGVSPPKNLRIIK